MAQLKAQIFVHLADNFPNKSIDQESAVDVDLSFANGTILSAKKIEARLSTLYEITVSDSVALGLGKNPTRQQAESAIKDLILAFNLESPRTVFVPFEQAHGELKLLEEQDVEPAVVEKDRAGNVTIKVSERIRISEFIKITIGTRIVIDEQQTLEMFRRIRKLRADAKTPPDLLEGLERYDEGTSSLNRVTAVQKYAMAIDKVVNIGRTGKQQLKNAAWDAEVAKLSGGSARAAMHIRQLYNRTKHAHRTPAEQQFLIEALQNISRTAQEAKLMASETIKAKHPA